MNRTAHCTTQTLSLGSEWPSWLDFIFKCPSSFLWVDLWQVSSSDDLLYAPRLPFHYGWRLDEAHLPTLSILNDSSYSTKDFGNFLWETKSELQNTSLPFWGKICTKTQLISRTRWKYLLHPSSRRISLVQNRPNLKPACGGALHRKADSIQSNGPRQHTTLYEIRWLLKSFSQIKN